jgi:hypothetical protein
MAYDRNAFKDKVEEHVSGALLEFCKATLAKKNGQTRWIIHWMSEVSTLLNRNLVLVLAHSVRGINGTKGKRKACDEVFKLLRDKNDQYKRIAEGIIKNDYKLTKLKHSLDDRDTNAFWQKVEDIVSKTLDILDDLGVVTEEDIKKSKELDKLHIPEE